MEFSCTKCIGLDQSAIHPYINWHIPIELLCNYSSDATCLLVALENEGIFIQEIDEYKVLFLNTNAHTKPTKDFVHSELARKFDILIDITDKFNAIHSHCPVKIDITKIIN